MLAIIFMMIIVITSVYKVPKVDMAETVLAILLDLALMKYGGALPPLL